MLRVRPVLGRTFQPEDAREGAPKVIMLGYETWKNRYGGDPSIVGRVIRLEQSERQVVGVAPQGFTFPPTATTDVILPLTFPTVAPAQRRNGWTFALARLKPGKTVDDAATNLSSISRQLESEYPQSNLASEYYPLELRTRSPAIRSPRSCSCSPRSASSCSLRARTSRTCCSRGPSVVDERCPFGSR